MDRVRLILLCGIPGSGKTTYAQKYIQEHPGTVHLSSDKIRFELWGNEATQGDNNEVFYRMQTRAIDALNFGSNVIYDCTNLTRKDRASIIAACPKFAKIEAHVIWAPIETCIERDANRKRTVGKEVIDRMLKRFQPPFYEEGIDAIYLEWPEEFNPDLYAKNMWNKIKIPHDNPHHTFDINEHCLEASNLASKFNNFELEYAAMWHDIGKAYTKAFIDSKGNPCETAHYYSHQNVSAWISYGLPFTSPTVAWLIGAHMEPFGDTKYYKKLPYYLKTLVDQLHECDLNAH